MIPAKRRRNSRQHSYNKRVLQAKAIACPNCGEMGAHFVPPSFGDPGFFFCVKAES